MLQLITDLRIILPVTSEDLIRNLPIVAEDYITAASQQATLFMEAARFRVAKMRKVSTATANVETLESAAALIVRNRRDEDGKKPTEGFVKDSLNANKKIRQAREERDNAYAEEELSKLILEAYRHRRDAIRVIADHANYEGMQEAHELNKLAERKRVRDEVMRLDKKRREVERDDPPF